jgi:predicted phage tail protein
MKGPDTQTEGADKSNSTRWARNQSNHLRRIVATQHLKSDTDYWIRFRAVDEAGKEFMFDYLELCPKSVYDNPLQKEDRH